MCSVAWTETRCQIHLTLSLGLCYLSEYARTVLLVHAAACHLYVHKEPHVLREERRQCCFSHCHCCMFTQEVFPLELPGFTHNICSICERPFTESSLKAKLRFPFTSVEYCAHIFELVVEHCMSSIFFWFVACDSHKPPDRWKNLASLVLNWFSQTWQWLSTQSDAVRICILTTRTRAQFGWKWQQLPFKADQFSLHLEPWGTMRGLTSLLVMG